jgi:hypothetical protein
VLVPGRWPSNQPGLARNFSTSLAASGSGRPKKSLPQAHPPPPLPPHPPAAASPPPPRPRPRPPPPPQPPCTPRKPPTPPRPRQGRCPLPCPLFLPSCGAVGLVAPSTTHCVFVLLPVETASMMHGMGAILCRRPYLAPHVQSHLLSDWYQCKRILRVALTSLSVHAAGVVLVAPACACFRLSSTAYSESIACCVSVCSSMLYVHRVYVACVCACIECASSVCRVCIKCVSSVYRACIKCI